MILTARSPTTWGPNLPRPILFKSSFSLLHHLIWWIGRLDSLPWLPFWISYLCGLQNSLVDTVQWAELCYDVNSGTTLSVLAAHYRMRPCNTCYNVWILAFAKYTSLALIPYASG